MHFRYVWWKFWASKTHNIINSSQNRQVSTQKSWFAIDVNFAHFFQPCKKKFKDKTQGLGELKEKCDTEFQNSLFMCVVKIAMQYQISLFMCVVNMPKFWASYMKSQFVKRPKHESSFAVSIGAFKSSGPQVMCNWSTCTVKERLTWCQKMCVWMKVPV